MRAHLSLAAAVAAALAACGPDTRTDDRFVDHDGDGFVASVDCDDGNRSAWRLLPVYRDADADGLGAGPASTVCAGAVAPAGWATVAGDCDDAHPDLWREVAGYADADLDGVGAGETVTECRGDDLGGLAETAGDCAPADGQRWRLVSGWVDADGDGLGAGDGVTECRGDDLGGLASAAGDCAPDDPGAWRELAYAYRDRDLDEVFVPEVGFACSGPALPPGYALGPVAVGDCDDGDAAASVLLHAWPDEDADGVGAGEPRDLCTAGALPERWAPRAGDCAPDDLTRYQVLPYAFADGDHDTFLAPHEGAICAGASLPAGYAAAVSTIDCDDQDDTRWATWIAYPDADGDGFGAGASEPLCVGRTRPDRWSEVAGDCAPDDDQRWRELPYSYRDADGDTRTVAAQGTVCSGTSLPAGYATLASGNDCDDANPDVFASLAGWPDADEDTFGAGAAGTFCTAGALPPGYVANATDCAADDPDRWRMLPYAGVDVDEDTWTTGPAGTLCAGAALPAPYVAKAHGNDCDDAGPLLWRWVVLYEDQDGDGVGVPPRSIPCLGATLPDGWSLLGYDPDDRDPTRLADADIEDLLLNVL
jgi:hypothetical protein